METRIGPQHFLGTFHSVEIRRASRGKYENLKNKSVVENSTRRQTNVEREKETERKAESRKKNEDHK